MTSCLHFDYYNNLLFAIPNYLISGLQTLPNSLVHYIYLVPHRSHDSITPLLKELNWLPIMLITHKTLYHYSPGYLSDILIQRPDSDTTISTNENILTYLS